MSAPYARCDDFLQLYVNVGVHAIGCRTPDGGKAWAAVPDEPTCGPTRRARERVLGRSRIASKRTPDRTEAGRTAEFAEIWPPLITEGYR